MDDPQGYGDVRKVQKGYGGGCAMSPNRVAVRMARAIVLAEAGALLEIGPSAKTLAREYLKAVHAPGDWHFRRGGKKAPARLAKKKGHAG